MMMVVMLQVVRLLLMILLKIDEYDMDDQKKVGDNDVELGSICDWNLPAHSGYHCDDEEQDENDDDLNGDGDQKHDDLQDD